MYMYMYIPVSGAKELLYPFLCALCREALLSVAQTFFENEDLGNESVKVK